MSNFFFFFGFNLKIKKKKIGQNCSTFCCFQVKICHNFGSSLKKNVEFLGKRDNGPFHDSHWFPKLSQNEIKEKKRWKIDQIACQCRKSQPSGRESVHSHRMCATTRNISKVY